MLRKHIFPSKSARQALVLVHGFGASPYKTWTWNQDDQDSSWPTWLPDCDPTLATSRISTFGYNAKLKGSVTSLDIVDYAKDLLFALRAAFDSQGQSQSQPIILIAHSLGGLVVKKAYTLGKHDEQYKGIAQRVRGMIFLATPHRGSLYAKMLKNVLSTGPAGHRTHIRDTLAGQQILAVLDYPNEQAVSMGANHHSICKYENPCSVNFVKIKSILLIWAAQLLEEDMYSEYAKPPHKASANEKVDGPPIALANTNTTSVGNKVYQDNQRFYDVRGSSRNVWEPDVEDPFNHTGSFTPSTEPVIANLSSESSKVTAICISPDPGFFACGRSDGSVSINETDQGCKLRGVAQHNTSVTKLAWSPSGRHIV
ncbi:hypothetical protein NHJ13734_004942 [Beauveria thailandica]